MRLSVIAGLGVAAIAWFALSRSPPVATPATDTACLTEHRRLRVLGTTATRVHVDASGGLPGAMGAGASTAGAPADQTVVERWQLAVEAVGRRGDGATLLAVRHESHQTSVDGHDPSQEQPGSAALVALDGSCRIVGVARQAGGGDRALHAALAELNHVRPARPAPAQVQQAMDDALGQASWRFERRGDSVLGVLLGYASLRARGDGPRAIEASDVRGSLELEGAAGGWFQTLRRRRQVGYFVGGVPVAQVSVEVSARTEPGDAVDIPRDGWAWGSALDDEAPAIPRPGTQTVASAPYGAAELDLLLASFAAGLGVGGNYAERVGLLSTWLREHPDAAPALLARLAAGELDGVFGARSAAFLAIGMADVAATRQALQAFVDDDAIPLGYRLHAAWSLQASSEPQPRLAERLIAWTEDTGLDAFGRGSAWLALGAMAGAGGDPALQARVADRIGATLTDPEADAESLAFALQAAGNSAHPALAEAVAGFLDDEARGLDELAADAMGHMPAEAAAPHLTGVLRSGPRELLALTAMRGLARTVPAVPLADGVVDQARDVARTSANMGAFEASVGLLGAAGRAGDVAASDALRALWAAELARSPRDADRLALLGRYVTPAWGAE